MKRKGSLVLGIGLGILSTAFICGSLYRWNGTVKQWIDDKFSLLTNKSESSEESSSSGATIEGLEGVTILNTHTHYDDIEGVNGEQIGAGNPVYYMLEFDADGLPADIASSTVSLKTEIVEGDASAVEFGAFGKADHLNITSTSITTYPHEEFYLKYIGTGEGSLDYKLRTTIVGYEDAALLETAFCFVLDSEVLTTDYSNVCNLPDGMPIQGNVLDEVMPADGLFTFGWDVTIYTTDLLSETELPVSPTQICVVFDSDEIMDAGYWGKAYEKDPTRFFISNGDRLIVSFNQTTEEKPVIEVPWHATFMNPYMEQMSSVYGTVRVTLEGAE